MKLHADLWNECADAWTERYEAIGDDQWNADTPCEGWDVEALVDHMVNTQANFAAPLVGAQIPESASWPEVRAAISDALGDGSVLEGTTEMPAMGEVPKAMMFGIATSDMLIHTWDLARAIGADETLPADAVAAAHEGLKRFPPDMMRAQGRFAQPVEPAADADAQTEMLNFTGRRV